MFDFILLFFLFKILATRSEFVSTVSIMAERDTSEFNVTIFEKEVLCIWGLCYFGILLQHVEQVLNIHLGLGNLPEECTHVEKGSC